MKKVVITGATGAIGRALITVCIKAGYAVLAVVHRNSQRASELEKIEHCKVLYLDLSEYAYALDEMKEQGIAFDDLSVQDRKINSTHAQATESNYEFFSIWHGQQLLAKTGKTCRFNWKMYVRLWLQSVLPKL